MGEAGGKRGMHAASGAYWNGERDGMWNFKYEGAEGKGFDGGLILGYFLLCVSQVVH